MDNSININDIEFLQTIYSNYDKIENILGKYTRDELGKLISNTHKQSIKEDLIEWFGDDNEFIKYIINSHNLDINIDVKNLDYMVHVNGTINWNDNIIKFQYFGDDSFYNYGSINILNHNYTLNTDGYYNDMIILMNNLGINDNNKDKDLIFRFHIFMAQICMRENSSKYPLSSGNCYTFTYKFSPKK
jgi:hypothetical protein